MKALKIIGIIVLSIFIVLFVLYTLYIWIFVGITKKQKFNTCVEKCEELMIHESSKRYCAPECTEITGYSPTAEDKKEQAEIEKKEVEQKVIAEIEEYKNKELYCNWVWPQQIIERESKNLVIKCPSSYPWCDYSDFDYENVGCCKDREHLNCLGLSELLQ